MGLLGDIGDAIGGAIGGGGGGGGGGGDDNDNESDSGGGPSGGGGPPGGGGSPGGGGPSGGGGSPGGGGPSGGGGSSGGGPSGGGSSGGGGSSSDGGSDYGIGGDTDLGSIGQPGSVAQPSGESEGFDDPFTDTDDDPFSDVGGDDDSGGGSSGGGGSSADGGSDYGLGGDTDLGSIGQPGSAPQPPGESEGFDDPFTPGNIGGGIDEATTPSPPETEFEAVDDPGPTELRQAAAEEFSDATAEDVVVDETSGTAALRGEVQARRIREEAAEQTGVPEPLIDVDAGSPFNESDVVVDFQGRPVPDFETFPSPVEERLEDTATAYQFRASGARETLTEAGAEAGQFVGSRTPEAIADPIDDVLEDAPYDDFQPDLEDELEETREVLDERLIDPAASAAPDPLVETASTAQDTASDALGEIDAVFEDFEAFDRELNVNRSEISEVLEERAVEPYQESPASDAVERLLEGPETETEITRGIAPVGAGRAGAARGVATGIGKIPSVSTAAGGGAAATAGGVLTAESVRDELAEEPDFSLDTSGFVAEIEVPEDPIMDDEITVDPDTRGGFGDELVPGEVIIDDEIAVDPETGGGFGDELVPEDPIMDDEVVIPEQPTEGIQAASGQFADPLEDLKEEPEDPRTITEEDLVNPERLRREREEAFREQFERFQEDVRSGDGEFVDPERGGFRQPDLDAGFQPLGELADDTAPVDRLDDPLEFDTASSRPRQGAFPLDDLAEEPDLSLGLDLDTQFDMDLDTAQQQSSMQLPTFEDPFFEGATATAAPTADPVTNLADAEVRRPRSLDLPDFDAPLDDDRDDGAGDKSRWVLDIPDPL